ncbi:MAG: 50S ribosomal protein L24 [Gammaproteobacteria bacterium]|jgi:large subunit ribosomal protein L24
MRKIKKGDDVIVTTGKDKGKRGAVLSVQADGRVVVQNINMIKRHTKPNPARGGTGGIVEKEAPIHISNVALFNPVSRKADRVGVKVLENGKKVRQFKSNGEVVDI